MTMEMMTALAILTVAMFPLMTLQIAGVSFTRSLYHDTVLSELMTDRLAILREGGWEKYGLCENKEIALYGRAAKNLPQGRLKLTMRESKRSDEVREIILRWKEDSHEIERKSAVFVGQNKSENDEKDD